MCSVRPNGRFASFVTRIAVLPLLRSGERRPRPKSPAPALPTTDVSRPCRTAVTGGVVVQTSRAVLRAPRGKALVVGGLVAGRAIAALPAAAAPGHPASSHRMVSAVVVVRPGVHLPVAVAGGRVTHVFGRIGSGGGRAPMGPLARLAADPRVAGVSPDRAGTVSGYAFGKDKGKDGSASVFASDAVGGDAGAPNTGRGVNVAMLDTGLSDTDALSRASRRVTDGVDVSQLAADGTYRTSGEPFKDGYGHGTFLASLIAGGKVTGSGGHALGVAPGARIVVVKVADDNGATTLSEVLAGMDWVAAHARAIQVMNVAL